MPFTYQGVDNYKIRILINHSNIMNLIKQLPNNKLNDFLLKIYKLHPFLMYYFLIL